MHEPYSPPPIPAAQQPPSPPNKRRVIPKIAVFLFYAGALFLAILMTVFAGSL